MLTFFVSVLRRPIWPSHSTLCVSTDTRLRNCTAYSLCFSCCLSQMMMTRPPTPPVRCWMAQLNTVFAASCERGGQSVTFDIALAKIYGVYFCFPCDGRTLRHLVGMLDSCDGRVTVEKCPFRIRRNISLFPTAAGSQILVTASRAPVTCASIAWLPTSETVC